MFSLIYFVFELSDCHFNVEKRFVSHFQDQYIWVMVKMTNKKQKKKMLLGSKHCFLMLNEMAVNINTLISCMAARLQNQLAIIKCCNSNLALLINVTLKS